MCDYTPTESIILDKMAVLKGETINICHEIFRMIMESDEDKAELFRFFCEQGENVRTDEAQEAEETFSEQETKNYTKRCGKLVDGILEKLLCQRLPKQEFYRKLWSAITTDFMFEDEKEQSFAFYYLWIDSRLPYFEISCDSVMGAEEFESIADEILPYRQRARFIMTSDFEHWPDMTYLLVELLDELQDVRQKTVLLAQILQMKEQMDTSAPENQ